MPLPCHSVPLRFLKFVFPIWLRQCGRVWFTLVMPCPCHGNGETDKAALYKSNGKDTF
jgi:hypothetical protein